MAVEATLPSSKVRDRARHSLTNTTINNHWPASLVSSCMGERRHGFCLKKLCAHTYMHSAKWRIQLVAVEQLGVVREPLPGACAPEKRAVSAVTSTASSRSPLSLRPVPCTALALDASHQAQLQKSHWRVLHPLHIGRMGTANSDGQELPAWHPTRRREKMRPGPVQSRPSLEKQGQGLRKFWSSRGRLANLANLTFQSSCGSLSLGAAL